MHLFLKGLLVVLTSLGIYRNYGHQQFQISHMLNAIDGGELGIVEFDDEGYSFDKDDKDHRSMIRNLVEKVRQEAQNQHTLVLVFVHGWHHNAKDDDDNLSDFKRRIKSIDVAINDPQALGLRRQLLQDVAVSLNDSQARAYLETAPDSKLRQNVIGIYIGWRGRSMPGLLDYTTFWGRYPAAARVGVGGAADLLLQLNKMYDELNIDGHELNRPEGLRLTNLVVIGHSFGGAVVLSAVETQLQASLNSIRYDIENGKGQSLPGECKLPNNENTFPLIRGLGDLVVLINPAVEALSYERILDAAGKDAKFSPCQTPIILTISADNDRARQFWFSGAQSIPRLLRASNSYKRQGDLFRQALGEYDEQKTHRLELPGKNDRCKAGDQYPFIQTAQAPEIHPAKAGRYPAVSVDDEATSATCFYPKNSTIDIDNPFIVATASKKVINGHNGVFDPNIDSFLTAFVSAIEVKKEKLIPIEKATQPIRTVGLPQPSDGEPNTQKPKP